MFFFIILRHWVDQTIAYNMDPTKWTDRTIAWWILHIHWHIHWNHLISMKTLCINRFNRHRVSLVHSQYIDVNQIHTWRLIQNNHFHVQNTMNFLGRCILLVHIMKKEKKTQKKLHFSWYTEKRNGILCLWFWIYYTEQKRTFFSDRMETNKFYAIFFIFCYFFYIRWDISPGFKFTKNVLIRKI